MFLAYANFTTVKKFFTNAYATFLFDYTSFADDLHSVRSLEIVTLLMKDFLIFSFFFL